MFDGISYALISNRLGTEERNGDMPLMLMGTPRPGEARVLICLRKRVEDCVESLSDSSAVARCTAARALGQMGPQAWEALPALLQALKDREPLVRDAVADAIGCIGPASPDAVHALEQAITDSNAFVQATAAKALKKIGAVRA